MANPESNQNKNEEVPEKDPIEVLREGREVMKNPIVKEKRERLMFLRHEQRMLEKEYYFYNEGIRRNTIKNLSAERQEEIKRKARELGEALDKNEKEEAELRREVEGLEDAIKEDVLNASKKYKQNS